MSAMSAANLLEPSSATGTSSSSTTTTQAPSFPTLVDQPWSDPSHDWNGLDQRIERLEQQCEQGRFIDACKLANGYFGPSLHEWPDKRGQRLAIQIASQLGGWQLSRVLRFQFTRRFAGTPEARFYTIQRRVERSALASVWLDIRDEELPSPWHRLQSAWNLLKADIVSVFRDFELAHQFIDRAEQISPELTQVQLARVHVVSESGHRVEALESCRQLHQRYPLVTSIVSALGHLLTQANQIDEAIATLEQHLPHAQSGAILVQLIGLLMQTKNYERAGELLCYVERYFPLACLDVEGQPKPRSVRAQAAALRSELAYHLADYTRCIEEARRSRSAFHIRLADHLEQFAGNAVRKELKVPFQQQAHRTCAPATLSMLAGYFQVEIDHDEIAREICFDGTSTVNQRLWAESKGFVAREFSLTEEAARRLINRRIPFAVSTVEADSAHVQVICGYDTRRGVLLVQDPDSWYLGEYPLEPMLQQYAWSGPRGFVMVPRTKAEIVDSLELPEVTQYDWLYQLELAFRAHNRPAAQALCQRFQDWNASHRLTHWSQWLLGGYDESPETSLTALNALWQQFPATEALGLRQANLLVAMGRVDEAIGNLRGAVERQQAGIASIRYLLTLLSDDCEAEISRLLCEVLRRDPDNELALLQEAARRQRNKCYADAFELLRLAAHVAPDNERVITNLLALAKRFHRESDVLAMLEQRDEQLGHLSGRPALIYARALVGECQSARAVQVLRAAIARRPDDGELLCDAAQMIGSIHPAQEGLALLEHATTPLPALRKWQVLAELAERDGRLADALHAHQEAIKLGAHECGMAETIARLTAQVEGTLAAVRYIRRLAERHPRHGHVLAQAATWLGHVHEHAEAITYLDRAIAIDRTNGWAWRERAIACQALGKLDDALTSANQSLDYDRSFCSYQIRASVLVGLRRFPEARNDFRAAIEMQVDSAYAIHGLIDLCTSDDERRQELRFVHDQLLAQSITGTGLEAYYQRARWLLSEEELQSSLQQVRHHWPGLLTATTLAARHLREHRREADAAQLLESSAAGFTTSAAYWSELGACYLTRELEKAIAAYERAFGIDPNSIDCADQLIGALRQADRLPEARAITQRALCSHPDSAKLRLDAAQLSESPTQQIKHAQAAAYLAPRWNEAWQYLEQLAAPGDRKPLLEVARELVQHQPHDAAGHMRLGYALSAQQQSEEARTAFLKAIELEPSYADAHRQFAVELARQGRTELAVKVCETRDVAPSDARELQCFAAELLHAAGETERACTQLLAAIQDDHSQIRRWCQLADYAEEANQFSLYARAAEVLIQQTPQSEVAWGYYHLVHRHAGDDVEAEACLRRALELTPDYEYGFRQLAELLMMTQRWSEAEKLLTHADAAIRPHLVWELRLTMALRRADVAQFEAVMRQAPGDAVNDLVALRRASESWDEEQYHLLRPALLNRFFTQSATTLLGAVFAMVSVPLVGLSHTLDDLALLPDSEAWQAAAHELAENYFHQRLPEQAHDDRGIATTFLSFLRTHADRISRHPEAWRMAIWIAAAANDLPTAHRLAQGFDISRHRSVSALHAGLAGAIMSLDWKLADRLIEATVDAGQPLTSDVKTLLVYRYAFQGDFERVTPLLLQIDRERIEPSHRPLLDLIICTLHAFDSGSTQAFDAQWRDGFAADRAPYEQAFYHKLRHHIAARRGRWLESAKCQWKVLQTIRHRPS